MAALKKIEVVAGVITAGAELPCECGVGLRYFATQRGYGDFKGFWEFPGGKIEVGESREEALARELKEELAVDVDVGDFICTVEHDYPKFHLIMHCFYCTIKDGTPTLLEHEAARWLTYEELSALQWCPADVKVVEAL